jgi:hypothetical protein
MLPDRNQIAFTWALHSSRTQVVIVIDSVLYCDAVGADYIEGVRCGSDRQGEGTRPLERAEV